MKTECHSNTRNGFLSLLAFLALIISNGCKGDTTNMDAAPPLVNVLQESDSAILQPLFKDPYQLKGHEFDNIKMELTSLAHFETELKLAKQGDLCIMKGKAEVAQIDIFANRVIRWNEGYYITPKDLLEYYP